MQPGTINHTSSGFNSEFCSTDNLKMCFCVVLCLLVSSDSRESDCASFFLVGSECKTEVGVSSCLLTPTASPRDSGLSDERGMNGGVSSEG